MLELSGRVWGWGALSGPAFALSIQRLTLSTLLLCIVVSCYIYIYIHVLDAAMVAASLDRSGP